MRDTGTAGCGRDGIEPLPPSWRLVYSLRVRPRSLDLRRETHMRALAFLLILSLSSSLPGQIAGKAATIDPMDPGFNSGTEGKIKIFHIGPYTIPAGRMIGT